MKSFITPFLRNNKVLFLAYDHGFEHGPKDLVNKSIDPEYILDLASTGGYTGIILQKGIAEKYYYGTNYSKRIPLILKLNGKTNLRPQEEPYSAINCSVAYAKKLGAQAVGYTIYLGSEKEDKMLFDFGQIQEQAHNLGMAVIAWMYPRGKVIMNESSPEIINYASRIGLELGADLIKIKYPGSLSALKEAVSAAGKAKIILSGGEKLEESDFLKISQEAMEAGLIGLAVGRNIWQRNDALAITEKLKQIIWSTP